MHRDKGICLCWQVSYQIKMSQTALTARISLCQEEAWQSIHLYTTKTPLTISAFLTIMFRNSFPYSIHKTVCRRASTQIRMGEALVWARVRADLWARVGRSKFMTTKESMNSMLCPKLASSKTWSSSKEIQIQLRKTIWNEKSSIYCLKLRPNFQQIRSIQY